MSTFGQGTFGQGTFGSSVATTDSGSFAQEIYENDLYPLAFADEKNDWALKKLLGAIGQMFQEIDDYARDTEDGKVGWSVLVDIDRAPEKILPWLAQFVGVRTIPSMSGAAQRARIQSADGWRRGTPAAMVGAVSALLTGTKVVVFRERDTDPYHLTVETYASQTPSSAAVLAALLTQKPAGIVLNYITVTGQDYQTMLNNHATYSNLFTSYTSYQGIVNDAPGT